MKFSSELFINLLSSDTKKRKKEIGKKKEIKKEQLRNSCYKSNSTIFTWYTYPSLTVALKVTSVVFFVFSFTLLFWFLYELLFYCYNIFNCSFCPLIVQTLKYKSLVFFLFLFSFLFLFVNQIRSCKFEFYSNLHIWWIIVVWYRLSWFQCVTTY